MITTNTSSKAREALPVENQNEFEVQWAAARDHAMRALEAWDGEETMTSEEQHQLAIQALEAYDDDPEPEPETDAQMTRRAAEFLAREFDTDVSEWEV